MTDPVVTAVKTDVTGETTKTLTFFEKNPKAIAIGAGILGFIVGLALVHWV